MSLRKIIGDYGENIAVKYLIKNKYNILDSHFSSRFGEIDIIARDAGSIAFVEVKARSKDAQVSGTEAVDRSKRKKLRATACFYASNNGDNQYRFDVLEIVQGKGWRQYNLFKAAFDYTT